jgi:TonB-linked SusC/RagA family outer membrane protein
MFRSITTHPLLPVYDIKAGWAHFDTRAFFDNPVALRISAKDDKSISWETFGNIYAEVDFLKNFTARSSFGGNINNYYLSRFDFWTYYPRIDSLPDNALTESSGYRWSWTWTNTLKYSKKIRDAHRINALAGIEAINNYNREVGGRSAGFYTNDVNYRFLSNGIPSSVAWARSNYSFAGASSLYAFISQLDYSFMEKYFLRGTLRKDGASFFGSQNRYGWFPSVSAAWRITQEYFLNQVEWIDELKLRASWGKTGFYGNTDPFNQYTLYGGSIGDAYYDINGNNMPLQGFRTLQLGDPNTGWQDDVVTNIGFESVFLKGKLSTTFDWYSKKARGLLFPVVLPDILGGAAPPNVNVGVVQNKGFDILIGSKGNWSADWKWDATTTISIYKNKILRLSNLAYYIPPVTAALGYVRNQVGHPASSFYGYKIIGIFKDDIEVSNAPAQDAAKPGRFRYLDANNDKVINEDDRVFLGDANPDFTLGINLGINYRNFDLSTFFYGSFGNEVINVPRTSTDFFAAGFYSAKSKDLLYDSWTPQNTGATIPIIENSYNFSNIATVNSYLLEDGSYFRNKSVILGYTFSKKILQKIKIEKLRIYLQAVNLFTITNYKGLDPELPGNSSAFGIDFGNYPNNEKRFLFGISMSF